MSIAEVSRFEWEPGDVVIETALTASATLQFANPWHDELGRFAPKGYQRSGTRMTRSVALPDNPKDHDMLVAVHVLYETVVGEEAEGLQQEAVRALRRTAKEATPELVELYAKPISRALAEGQWDQAGDLITELEFEVMTNFDETFDVPAPEAVAITQQGGTWRAMSHAGETITLDPSGHDVSDEQAEMILSAAVTSARAGEVIRPVRIEINPSFNADMDRISNASGFVVYNASAPDRHLTINLTPELIAGRFLPEGPHPRDPDAQMASSATVNPIRWTVQHEMGHVSLFEQVTNIGRETVQGRLSTIRNGLTDREAPLMSAYGRTSLLETHAEAFAEWSNTAGSTNNPIVLQFAREFGWDPPRALDEALAAAGPPPANPIDIPEFEIPESGEVVVIDTADQPVYIYSDEPRMFSFASLQFANPWHDNLGRFAPKGTGTIVSDSYESVEALAEGAELELPNLLKHAGATTVVGHMSDAEKRAIADELNAVKLNDLSPTLTEEMYAEHEGARRLGIDDPSQLPLGVALQFASVARVTERLQPFSYDDGTRVGAAVDAYNAGGDIHELSAVIEGVTGVGVVYGAVDFLNSSWHESAVSLGALAFHRQAAEQFNLGGAQRSMDSYLPSGAAAAGAELHSRMSNTAQIVLQSSQEAVGATINDVVGSQQTVRLYRGIQSTPRTTNLAGSETVQTNPLSSWSSSARTAETFARSGGYVVEVDVPVGDIIGVAGITGWGSANEREFIVLGRERPSTIRRRG